MWWDGVYGPVAVHCWDEVHERVAAVVLPVLVVSGEAVEEEDGDSVSI